MIYILKMLLLVPIFLLEQILFSLLLLISLIIWKDIAKHSIKPFKYYIEEKTEYTSTSYPLTYLCYLTLFNKI